MNEVKEIMARGIAEGKACYTAGSHADAELIETHLALPSTKRHAQAALSALEASGYAIVPVEPSEGMVDAGDLHFPDGPLRIYTAMIAASKGDA